jgi:hypothetical protein
MAAAPQMGSQVKDQGLRRLSRSGLRGSIPSGGCRMERCEWDSTRRVRAGCIEVECIPQVTALRVGLLRQVILPLRLE